MKIVQVSDELRATPAFAHIRREWPEIVLHDAVSNAYWRRLYSERREFQFALVEDAALLAEGNSIPVSGMPAGWLEALSNGFDKCAPDRLCALAVLVDPDYQGRGLSRVMLEHMRACVRARMDLIAPVRPSLKGHNPLLLAYPEAA